MAVPETIQDNRANGHRLEPLPYPVYFVHPYRERWADIFEATEPPEPDLIYWRFADSNDVWVVGTYLRSGTTGSRSDSCRNWSLVRSTSS